MSVDSTSAKATDASQGAIGNVAVEGSLGAPYAGLPGLGWHYLQAIEVVTGGTATFYGNNYAHLSATVQL